MVKQFLRVTYVIKKNIDVELDENLDFYNLNPSKEEILKAKSIVDKASKLASIFIGQEKITKDDWVISSRAVKTK
jgi:hypothetical protein